MRHGLDKAGIQGHLTPRFRPKDSVLRLLECL